MSESKEIVWLPKALAEKVKDLQSDKQVEQTIIEYFNESKRNLKNELELMDDDVLQYKALMMKARNVFREAKEEQLEANYELWEKFHKDIKGVSQYVEKAKASLNPLKNEIEELKRLMQQVDKWEIEKFLGTVEKLNNCFYGQTGEMLKFLFENFKVKQSK